MGKASNEKRKSFVFYGSFRDAVCELSNDDRLSLYEAIINYGLDGEEPELSGYLKAMFALIKPNIDSSKAKREAGRKGGNTRVENANKGQADVKQPSTNGDGDANADKDTDVDAEGESTSNTPALYGLYRNILLSQDEYRMLADEFPYDYAEYIDRASSYVKEKGKKYANHYSVIRRWITEDQKKKRSVPASVAEDADDGLDDVFGKR